jgi:hypothetical protein
MFRMLKWTTPLVALALLLALGGISARMKRRRRTGTVSGTVLDKDGKAAAGVQVRLFTPYERGASRRRRGARKVEKQNADPADNTPANGEKPGKGEKGDRPARVTARSRSRRPAPTRTASSAWRMSRRQVRRQAMVRGVGGAREKVEVTAGNDAKVELKLKERPRASGDHSEKHAEKRAEKKAAKKLAKKVQARRS